MSSLGPGRSFLLWLSLFLLFIGNGRLVGGGDVVPAILLPVALLRGDGPVLDRFADALRDPDGRIPGFATESRGHVVSRYPLGAPIVALPFTLPQLALLDLADPSWEADGLRALASCRRMAKNASAAVAGLGAVLMAMLLTRMGLAREAVPAAVVVALGSDHWAVASQAPWQHGSAALCLAGALVLLRRPDGIPGVTGSPSRLAMAGASTAMMVVCRPIDAVFAVALSLWALANLDRRGRWAFHLPAVTIAAAWLSYNVWFFDTPYGGYADLEETHPWAHGTEGTWTGSIGPGLAGTLFSPSHGLLVYSPWIALAIALLPASVRHGRLPRTSPERWLLWALVPNLLMLAKYSCWWGGHCFGPRFWIDAGPIFAVALGLGLERALRSSRALLAAFALTAAWSITLQTVGFLSYPTSWFRSPTNADRDHARLWHWRDTEVSRGLAEGIKPRDW
ncbi:hypothetical protein [Tautonia sociabilis]|uniref:Glycosyltransferase RgtA/B/C/D-like domain-containing protein n=1 Tax=Tautonia sociabilis TaxID=2080755 RepID=A0A432MJE8_9BACT|nr:hypothetical protein [Tautonia sociabilis]RUL87266.1 hypothetical protein TsocGM_12845 [Tautonia sociabilis]